MNRRSFFTRIGLAAATLAILPSAATYSRTWVKSREALWIPNPAWESAPLEIAFDVGDSVGVQGVGYSNFAMLFRKRPGDKIGDRFASFGPEIQKIDPFIRA